MHQIFSVDSPLMSALTRIGDCICLSVLWVVFSLPIFTMGPATAALYAAAYHTIRMDEGRLWQRFWGTFREEFKRSALVGLISLGVMALLTVDVFVFRGINMSGEPLGWLYYVALFIWCAALTWTIYLAAYTARFTGNVRETLKFGYLLILLHPLRALAVLLIALGGLAVILMVPFLLLALPGAGMLLCTFPLEKVFQAHLRPEDRIQVVTESEEPTDDQ